MREDSEMGNAHRGKGISRARRVALFVRDYADQFGVAWSLARHNDCERAGGHFYGGFVEDELLGGLWRSCGRCGTSEGMPTTAGTGTTTSVEKSARPIWPTDDSLDFFLNAMGDPLTPHPNDTPEHVRLTLRAALLADPIVRAAVEMAATQAPSSQLEAEVYRAVENAGLFGVSR